MFFYFFFLISEFFLQMQLSLAKEDKRVYGLKDKQLMKMLPVALRVPTAPFAAASQEGGDISETAREWYSRAAAAGDGSGSDEASDVRPAKRARASGGGGEPSLAANSGETGADALTGLNMEAESAEAASGRAGHVLSRAVVAPGLRARGTGGVRPPEQPSLSLKDVDAFLDSLARMSREAEFQHALTTIVPRVTPLELKWLLRLVKHELRIGAQAAQFLNALAGEAAWEDYRRGADLGAVVRKHRATGGSAASSEVPPSDALPQAGASAGSSRAASALPGKAADASALVSSIGDKRKRGAEAAAAAGLLDDDDSRDGINVDAEDEAAESDQQELPHEELVRERETADIDEEPEHEPDYVDDEEEDPIDPAAAAAANVALNVRPGVPIKPMLAAPVSTTDAALSKCTGPVIAEIKYDGKPEPRPVIVAAAMSCGGIAFGQPAPSRALAQKISALPDRQAPHCSSLSWRRKPRASA